MAVFDVILDGYDGSTDETDHLILWILAENIHVVKRWLNETGLSNITSKVFDGMHAPNLGFVDGVDVILTEKAGRILSKFKFNRSH